MAAASEWLGVAGLELTLIARVTSGAYGLLPVSLWAHRVTKGHKDTQGSGTT